MSFGKIHIEESRMYKKVSYVMWGLAEANVWICITSMIIICVLWPGFYNFIIDIWRKLYIWEKAKLIRHIQWGKNKTNQNLLGNSWPQSTSSRITLEPKLVFVTKEFGTNERNFSKCHQNYLIICTLLIWRNWHH